ncbi:MAG TPA: XdhC/CoxI family protein [Blastocatellia bacterium]|nr:XdhC/CoxI family protein [Blastocatellia bacterium]
MDEFFTQIETIEKTERHAAMATLVATRGTSPKKEGAKMWVGEGGRILGSVTIGGCVDARVIEESEAALADFTPRLISVDLGEEDAWEGGFTCAGTIDVMIEPLNFADDNRLLALYRAVRAEVKKGKCAAVATPLAEPSSKLIVFEDGDSMGTLGDAGLDREARRVAVELIRKRTSRTVPIETDASPSEVFFEVHAPSASLIVFGAGQVSMSLVSLAKNLGFKTVVVDGRPRFATRERFPDAHELLIGIPSDIAGTLVYTPATLVVLAAHDYKYDIPVLKTVLKTEAGYIGLLGSKRRGRAILEFLRDGGVDARSLERVHVPTGLDIGAQSAAEIALSILAEAVAVRSGRPGSAMREKE